jgi:hypothetical protein
MRAIALQRNALLLGCAIAAIAIACGGSKTPAPVTASTAPGGSHDPSKWPKDDKSLCDLDVHWRSQPALEIQETVGPGAFKPNVRRVYKWMGDRDNRKKVLVCREIDTNLDGIKDVIRTFNDKGEAKHEEADTDYDGIIDVKMDFVDGRIAKEEIDTRHASTVGSWKPDVWKFYVDGKISRVRRNTHCQNGKADTWEIYSDGYLERIGNDASCDGHVDRWDRDMERMAQIEAEEKAKEAAAQADAGAQAAAASDAGAADGGKKTTSAKKPK